MSKVLKVQTKTQRFSRNQFLHIPKGAICGPFQLNLTMGIYLNADCMNQETGLPSFPDNHFDLAIVDPPFGIGAERQHFEGHGWKVKAKKAWDKYPPPAEFFTELLRVSKNQIIWGANYFSQYLPPSMGWICWDKMNHGFSLADGELAFTSFDVGLKIFQYARGNESGFAPKLKDWDKIGLNIHPTQKPIALYRWLLKNYAKQGDLILDTHVGSASSLIAFEEMGFDYVAFELDSDYYRESTERIHRFRSQGKLFSGSEIFEASKPATLF